MICFLRIWYVIKNNHVLNVLSVKNLNSENVDCVFVKIEREIIRIYNLSKNSVNKATNIQDMEVS